MDDKTMLELAALVAGVEFHGYDEKENCLFKRHKTSYGPGKSFWAPLTDDRDALRLAVKLRLDIEFLRGGDFVKVSTYYGDVSAEVEHTGDPAADTRRAIVRAAAEIGKGMGVG